MEGRCFAAEARIPKYLTRWKRGAGTRAASFSTSSLSLMITCVVPSRAAAAVGDSRYAVICRELNMASNSIDDIPTRDALQRLVARVETEAAGKNGNG